MKHALMPRTAWPLSKVPPLYTLPPASASVLLEITDGRDGPLLLMGQRAAVEQKLPHRQAAVLLRDRGGRVLLSRLAPKEPEAARFWDVSACGPVPAGEARESVVIRLLEQRFGFSGAEPVFRAVVPPLIAGDTTHLTLFSVICRDTRIFLMEARMLLDRDEIMGLVEHFPEIFTPCLLWCVREGYL